MDIEKTAYDSLLRKLPELDVHQRKVISKHMKSIINQMILGPIKGPRSWLFRKMLTWIWHLFAKFLVSQQI